MLNRSLQKFGLFALGCSLVAAAACVDDDGEPDLAEFEEIGFDQAGLQPDPLAGDEWPAGPDLEDVPACLRDDVELVLSEDTRLLIFDGSCDDTEYLYRAPVMEMLDDEEFRVAVPIMAVRTDRMGQAEDGPANGFSGGDGSSLQFISYLYDPDSPIIDPDADFDVEDNLEHLKDQIDEGLSDASGDDEFLVDLLFIPTVRNWQHYVDVLDPEEVASSQVAQAAGESRRDAFTADLIDISSAGVEGQAGCEEVARSTDTHRAVYSCTAEQVEALSELATRLVDIEFISEIPDDLDTQEEPIGNATSNMGE